MTTPLTPLLYLEALRDEYDTYQIEHLIEQINATIQAYADRGGALMRPESGTRKKNTAGVWPIHYVNGTVYTRATVAKVVAHYAAHGWEVTLRTYWTSDIKNNPELACTDANQTTAFIFTPLHFT